MEKTADVSRRELLRRLSGAIAAAALARWRSLAPEAAHAASGVKVPTPGTTAIEPANTRFFSAEENEAMAIVADLIIPDDEFSPGARAAGVPEWIDFVLANAPAAIQQQWREGLLALDRASEESAGKKFLELSHEQQRRLLESFVEREVAPVTPGERFFALAKEATVNGYYTSEIGLIKDLRYQGGTYVSEPDISCPARDGDERARRPDDSRWRHHS